MTYKTRREVAVIDDLQIIFTKFYSAEILTTYFNQLMARAAEDQEILNFIKANPAICQLKKRIKKHNVAAIERVFQDKQLLLTFYNQQSDICKKAIDHIVWYGDTNMELLEKRIKKTIATNNKSDRKHWEPFLLKDGLELFLLDKHDYNYYSEEAKTKKSIIVFLPEPISTALQEVIPKPAQYYISPLKRKQKTTFTYCNENSILTAIPKSTQFIKLGHLSLKQNGSPTVKGLRDFCKIAGVTEFYPDSKSKPLQRMQGIMLTTFFLSDKSQGVAIPSKPQVYLKKAFRQWIDKDKLIFIDQFLSHIRILRNSYDFYRNNKKTNIKKYLYSILKKLPTEGWVSITDIISFVEIHRINLLEFNQDVLEFRHYRKCRYYQGMEWAWTGVNRKNIIEVINNPVLKAFFFLAATLGLVEIGYNNPENSDFRLKEYEYLTEYDGLQQVKLTKLGAYISGKTRNYDANIIEDNTCKLHLDSTRLLLSMEGSDPIIKLNLNQVMEPAGAGRYMLTYNSLLKGCHNKEDVEKKIALFNQTISQTVETTPTVWQDFFKTTLERIDPISADPTFRVYKIVDNRDLLNILSTDPQISALILKVEGLRIAVELGNISKLTNLLKKHGFLLDNASLFLQNYHQ